MSHLVSFLARANRGEGNKRKKRKKKKKKKEKKEKNFRYVFGMISRVFHGD